MANLLWYNEGLYVDLPVGYVEDLTQVYDSSVGTIQYKQKIKFPPKLYYPMIKGRYMCKYITKQVHTYFEILCYKIEQEKKLTIIMKQV